MGKVRYIEVEQNGKTIIEQWHKIRAHRFNMGDVEDPQIYAGFGIHTWQQTDQGKFIMEHGKNHEFHTHLDHSTYGYQCVITCELESKKLSEYYLRCNKLDAYSNYR
jgi:hypothetical protein